MVSSWTQTHIPVVKIFIPILFETAEKLQFRQMGSFLNFQMSLQLRALIQLHTLI